MDDRTLLHLILILALLSLASNMLVLKQLPSSESVASGTPPANDRNGPPITIDKFPLMIAPNTAINFCVQNNMDKSWNVETNSIEDPNRYNKEIGWIHPGQTRCCRNCRRSLAVELNDFRGLGWYNAFFVRDYLWAGIPCVVIDGLNIMHWQRPDLADCFPAGTRPAGRVISIDEFPVAMDEPPLEASFCIWNPRSPTWDVYSTEGRISGITSIGTLERGQVRCCIGCTPDSIQLRPSDGSCGNEMVYLNGDAYKEKGCIIINACSESWDTRDLLTNCFPEAMTIDQFPAMVAPDPAMDFCVKNNLLKPWDVLTTTLDDPFIFNVTIGTIEPGRTRCCSGCRRSVAVMFNDPDGIDNGTVFFSRDNDFEGTECVILNSGDGSSWEKNANIKRCFPEGAWDLGKAISIDEFPAAMDEPPNGTSFCIWNAEGPTWDVYSGGPRLQDQQKIGTLERGQTRCCIGCTPASIQLKATDGSCDNEMVYLGGDAYKSRGCIVIKNCNDERRWKRNWLPTKCFMEQEP